MLALGVVEHLDVFEDVLPWSVACRVCASPYPFPLQELKEALGDSVIVTIPTPAHAGLQVVLAEKHLPLAAGELRSLIRMDHHLGLGFATPYGCEQGLQRDIGLHKRSAEGRGNLWLRPKRMRRAWS